MKCTRDKGIIIGFVVIGLSLAVAAAILVSITVLRPLWTVWGREETTRIIDQNYNSLFRTEAEMLQDFGNCTSYLETRGSKLGEYDVMKWSCDDGNSTAYASNQENQFTTDGTGAGNSRKKRQVVSSSTVSDNDNCCATLLQWTSPQSMWARVSGLNVNVQVVHFHWTTPRRLQFVHEGSCGAAGLCDQIPGTCVPHSRVQPVLVSSVTINNKLDLLYAVYDNNVWFENYEFPGSCKCVGKLF